MIPGSFAFLLCALACGAGLLYRGKDGGRAGRWMISVVVVLYWIWSTPILAVPLINLLTPGYPAVQSRAQAGGASAIVVLGAGMSVVQSRGDIFEIPSREDALRVMEAARVYHVLGEPWVIVTGLGSRRHTDAARMAEELQSLGIPAERIVKEGQARNTHQHGVYVPPLLRERQVTRFVLVTSRQHIARALRVFRKAGWDPIPSSPEPYVDDTSALNRFLPSRNALLASELLFYDEGAMVYYWLRGWI